jgi:ankyrin repeat protein
VEHSHKDVIELLLSKGADIHTEDNDGQTALHWALERGDKNIVEFLLSKGANVNVEDRDEGSK